MHTLKNITLLVITLVMASCGGSSKKEKLVLYSPHGKELLTEMKTRFEKRYPQVEVEWLLLKSQEVLDRVEAEKGNPHADLWWGAPATMFIHAKDDSLLEKFKPTWAANLNPAYRDADNYWSGTFLTPEVIMYNDSLLTRDQAPQDWDDLLKPEWKKRILVKDPVATGTVRTIFSSMIVRAPDEDKGFEWLLKLDAQTAEYVKSATQMYLGLGNPQTPVSIWNMPDIILQSNLNHYPFNYIWPSSGAIILIDGIAIIKGAKNKVWAEKFYEFVMEPENVQVLASQFYRIPTLDIIPPEQQPEWLKTLPKNQLTVDWQVITQKERGWMERWQNSIEGKGDPK